MFVAASIALMVSGDVQPHPSQLGSVLNGTWRIVQLLGEGGLSTVYEAEGLHGEGTRAIKLLRPHLLAERVLVERFYQEAKACFALRHPNIGSVEAYDYSEAGEPYIVMELLQGLTLAQHLKTYAPMQLDEAISVMHGILQALKFAHARGVVHRDLKPGNLILVPKSQGRYQVKVLDFGVAKFIEKAGSTASRTRTGEVLGTPGFMSPEQLKSAKSVDERTDLWSAAVVFYTMLVHRHPFGDGDNLARMLAVLRDPPLPISGYAPHLQRLDSFFERAFEKDVGKRFASAAAMAEALAAFGGEGSWQDALSSETTVSLEFREPQAEKPSEGGDEQPTRMKVPSTKPSAMATMPALVSTPPPGRAPVAATPPPFQSAPFKPAGPTQLSPAHEARQQAPVPRVFVEEARDVERFSVVWWGVLLIALVALGVGLGVGYLIGGGG